MSQIEPNIQTNFQAQSMSLLQFSLRDCPTKEDGVYSISEKNIIFGVNIYNPNFAIADTISSARNVGNCYYLDSSFSVTNLLNMPLFSPVSRFSMNSNMGVFGGLY